MLLDTTVTDSDKNCSLYNRSSILPAVDALNKRDDLTQKRGTMLYWIVSGTSEHVSYAILESDHIDKSHTVLHEVFVTHSAFKITPLHMIKDLLPARAAQQSSG